MKNRFYKELEHAFDKYHKEILIEDPNANAFTSNQQLGMRV
jgi:hypothetical protein